MSISRDEAIEDAAGYVGMGPEMLKTAINHYERLLRQNPEQPVELSKLHGELVKRILDADEDNGATTEEIASIAIKIFEPHLRQPERESGWVRASAETNPKSDGDYLTIYRERYWESGHYVQRVCRFSVGNSCTGGMWGGNCEIRGEWNVKYWQELPRNPTEIDEQGRRGSEHD